MGYSVKWMEDNLGITRKMLRGYEETGLMPANPNGAYRDYDDDDVDRLWGICILQGMGYTRKEIYKIINEEDFDFEESLAKKIEQLEKEKNDKELHLDYARTIKLTGRFPARPQNMGTVKVKEFQRESVQSWNIANEQSYQEYQKIVENVLSKEPEEWENDEVVRMLAFLGEIATIDKNTLLVDAVIPHEIVKRKANGLKDPETQLLIKILYDNYKKSIEDFPLSKDKFARFYGSSFLAGDIAKIRMREFIPEDCEFIADAVAVFAGYDSFNALTEAEFRYGRRKETISE